MVFWDTTYPIEHIREKKSLLQIIAKIGHNSTALKIPDFSHSKNYISVIITDRVVSFLLLYS